MSPLKLFLYRLRSQGDGGEGYIRSHIHTHIYVHAHTHTVAVASCSSLVRDACQERAQQWNTGSLVPGFRSAGSRPTSLQNTLRLRGTALSAVGRPGTENLDKKQERGRGGRAGFMRPFTFAAMIFFLLLNAFNTLLSAGERAHRQFFFCFVFLFFTNLKVKERRSCCFASNTVRLQRCIVDGKLCNQEFDTETNVFQKPFPRVLGYQQDWIFWTFLIFFHFQRKNFQSGQSASNN